MNGMVCGQASGTCDARCMTDARLRLLGLGRLDEIRLALIQLLGYALQYSTPKGTVNVVSSVKLGRILHLTPSGVVCRVVGIEKKKLFRLVTVA